MWQCLEAFWGVTAGVQWKSLLPGSGGGLLNTLQYRGQLPNKELLCPDPLQTLQGLPGPSAGPAIQDRDGGGLNSPWMNAGVAASSHYWPVFGTCNQIRPGR